MKDVAMGRERQRAREREEPAKTSQRTKQRKWIVGQVPFDDDVVVVGVAAA